MNEDEVTAEQLPDEVLKFVLEAGELVAEHEGVPEEKIIFSGMTLLFVNLDTGKRVTFEVVKA